MRQIGNATGAIQCLACRGGICAKQVTPDTQVADLLLSTKYDVTVVMQLSYTS